MRIGFARLVHTVDDEDQSNRDARSKRAPRKAVVRGAIAHGLRAASGASLAAHEVVWDHFAHGADIGIRGRGETRDRAFAEAARALTAVVTDPEKVVLAAGAVVEAAEQAGLSRKVARLEPMIVVKG